MTEENIKKYISTMLGGSKLNIELDEQDFKEIIQHALEVLRPRYSGVRYIQVDGTNSPIDLSSHNIIEVIQIYEGQDTGVNQLQSQMFLNPGVFVFNSDFKDNYIQYLTYTKLASAYQTVQNATWKYDNVHKLLYLNKKRPQVLKALVELRAVTDIEETCQWFAWFKDYCLALAKICVGRMRSKYKLSNAQYELDGDVILNEGIQERDKLEEELKGLGIFPVM